MRRACVQFIAVLALTQAALAQTAWRDDFEGPEISLRPAGADAAYKLDFHERVTGVAHSGKWSERISIRGNNGSHVYFGRTIPPARVIAELVPSVWIRAERPGMQLLVRVVLPRTIDPQSGKKLTTLLRGSGYTQGGGWQQLRVENLPHLLEQQARVMRAESRRTIDTHEAYVDMLLVNVYGGPDVTNVWIDDAEVIGGVAPSDAQLGQWGAPTEQGRGPKLQPLPPTWAGGNGVPGVELRGTLLYVSGKPFFPRIIEYRGEPLSRLKSLGFNTIRFAETPPPQLVRAASNEGLWIVAPPPGSMELAALVDAGSTTAIENAFEPLLAWDLGSGLTGRQLDATREWARLVSAADRRGRPIVCEPESDLRSFTRPPVNLLIARREPLGSAFSMQDYARWLGERALLALPGTPLWAGVQTTYSERLAEQVQILAKSPLPMTLDEAQLRMLVRQALAGGARGLCFSSPSRLDADDPQTRRRAMLLEWINLELQLIEPWPASGAFGPQADSSDKRTTAAVIETDRSRLVMPIHAPPSSQCSPGNPTVKPLVITATGVPEDYKAYQVSPCELRKLVSQRVAGGTRVVLNETERDCVIVYTQDALVIRELTDRINKVKARAAELARELATAQLADLDAAELRLTEVGRAIPGTRTWHTAAEADLKQMEQATSKKDLPRAFEHARHAMSAMRDIGRLHWEKAAGANEWPLADPLMAQLTTLGDHYRFMHELASAPRAPNRLPAGEFEDLTQMLQSGWLYVQYEQPQIATNVVLAPEAAHAGRSGLRLLATSQADAKPSVVETPPLWVTSAPIPVEGGQLLEIRGWLRVPEPITGSVDGLLILDSITGEALSQRVSHAPQWRPFTLYRAVPRSGTFTLTFALTGLGEAWLDDISIQVIERQVLDPRRQAVQPTSVAR